MADFDRLISQLHTTRRNEFLNQEVKIELLYEILQTSVSAANASNRQSYSVIILNENKVKALNLPGNKAMVFCVDFFRLKNAALQMGLNFGVSHLSQFITAVCDVSILAQTALLIANSKGLSSLITNSLYYSDMEKVSQQLFLPNEGVFPLLTLCVGYSKGNQNNKKGRLPLSEIMHMDEYSIKDKLSVSDLIQYYNNNQMPLIDNWKGLDYSNYLEWFFEKWTPVTGSRENSQRLEVWLRERNLI